MSRELLGGAGRGGAGQGSLFWVFLSIGFQISVVFRFSLSLSDFRFRFQISIWGGFHHVRRGHIRRDGGHLLRTTYVIKPDDSRVHWQLFFSSSHSSFSKIKS